MFYSNPETKIISKQGSQPCKRMPHAEKNPRLAETRSEPMTVKLRCIGDRRLPFRHCPRQLRKRINFDEDISLDVKSSDSYLLGSQSTHRITFGLRSCKIP